MFALVWTQTLNDFSLLLLDLLHGLFVACLMLHLLKDFSVEFPILVCVHNMSHQLFREVVVSTYIFVKALKASLEAFLMKQKEFLKVFVVFHLFECLQEFPRLVLTQPTLHLLHVLPQ